MANDPVAATVDFLTDAGLAAGRVWGVALPGSETANMPRRAIVVRAAGGTGSAGGGYLPTVDERVDVRCYGEDPWDAKELANQAGRLLHYAGDEQTAHGRIISATRSGGTSDITETDTGWPLALTSWLVLGNWLE